MLSTKDVTVCIKAFARPNKLRKSLNAVINAGFENIIVGYDGPDNLKDIHKEVVQSFEKNIILKFYTFNDGLAAVRNKMIEEVTSKYILLLDDDEYIPSRISESLEYFKIREEIGVVSFPWRLKNLIDPPQYYYKVSQLQSSFPFALEVANFAVNKDIVQMVESNNVEYDIYDGNLYVRYFDYMPMCGFFRREIFDSIKFDERFIIGGEHQDFYLSLNKHTNFKCGVCLTIVMDHDIGKDDNDFPYLSYRHGEIEIRCDKLVHSKWGLDHISERANVLQFFYVNRDDVKICDNIIEVKSKDIRMPIKTID